jgi:sensor c-di-GMP phosphodiesterase-like protein
MPIIKKRILVTSMATLIVVAAGTMAGYLASRDLTLWLTESKLRQYATQTLTEADSASLESRAMLAAMRTSPFPFCSDEEIASFRNLIFLSEYLKEAGRVRDGQIQCSAMLGRLSAPIALPQPDLVQSDGTRVYTKLSQFSVGDLRVISVQLNDSYIVFSPYIETHRVPEPIHSTIVAIDASDRGNGAQSQAKGQVLSGDGQPRLDGSVNATVCSDRSSNCVTDTISIPDALQAGGLVQAGCMAAGGLAGLCIGLILALLQHGNQSIRKQLYRGIRSGRVQVVYQAIMDTVSGRVYGAEALARWTDEDGNVVEPEVFVQVAEECGFVGDLTKLVVRQVLRDFAKKLRSHPDFRISVNVAASDLTDPHFLPMLDAAMKRAAVPAKSLAIEITEGPSTRNEVVMETIRQLRLRGHSVMLDDFGTGYSSLSYLSANSVDAIKIDKPFTQAIGTSASNATILPQILSMAEALNLQVIVEGIETAQQESYFAEAGWPILAQGWFFGLPVPVDVFQDWLAEEEKKAQSAPAIGSANKY